MNSLRIHNVKIQSSTEVPAEVHDTAEARKLKESCQQFESILWAQIWKEAKDGARRFSSGEKAKPWKQVEDLSVEMASEEIAKSGGAGLWKVLYDQMIANVAADMEKTGKVDEAEKLDIKPL